MSVQLVREKCKEVFAKAADLYALDLSIVSIDCSLRGRVAGKAGYQQSRATGARTYFLKFNADLIDRELDNMLNDTVPHEIAHIVCYMKPELGSGHDYGWKRVCKALGGSGETKHSLEVVYGTGNTYEYTSASGHTVRLSEQRHKKIQQDGRCLRFQHGIIDKSCSFVIVGCSGRTLDKPMPGNVSIKPVQTVQQTPTPVKRIIVPTAAPVAGESKADAARRLILAGHRDGLSADVIIMQIMETNGHTKALATSYYKNNAPKLGIQCPA